MASRSALITGISGQDGQLLARQLSERNWRIVGVVPVGTPTDEADALTALPGVSVIPAELADVDTCRRVVADARPDTLFHLAAISSVGRSWEIPVETCQLNGMATVALMSECLALKSSDGHEVRFVNASSAEIFAATAQFPQNEQTPLSPSSPYGVAKAFAHMMADTYRARGLWVSNAILYNHESPLRPKGFVTRKITAGVAAIVAGEATNLRLGNLDARRDWGWAPDYVDCLIRMATHDEPENFVVATGRSHSVRDFVAAAFSVVGIEDWQSYVEVETDLLRPTDAVELIGDASKARRVLQWGATKDFQEIVESMVIADLKLVGRSDAIRPSG